MGTAFAGIVRSPLTSVIMIFEVTRDYNIIVPLMISNLIAFFISQWLQKEPIYEALARQDGVHLPTAHSRAQTGRIQVRQAMRPAPTVLPLQADVAAALNHLKGDPFDAWPVSDGDGLFGMVRKSELERAVSDGAAGLTLAETLPTGEEPPHVHPDHSLSLSLALERMGSTGLNVLPVVSRASVRVLMGIIVLDDVLQAYGVAKRGME
jgi:CIC family chloride channel protein